MSKKIAGPEIERLIQLLARLPGLGPRSARKAALTLIKRRADLMQPLAQAMGDVARVIVECARSFRRFDTRFHRRRYRCVVHAKHLSRRTCRIGDAYHDRPVSITAMRADRGCDSTP